MQNDTLSRPNGNGKIFNLTPAGPDIGSLILEARDEVVEDNSLSLGARLMFVRILDLSVRQASNVAPGVVTISQTKLAEKFNVSLRSIFNWKSQLVEAGYIWMSSQPMPNAWPIDTYHVTKIHAPRNSGDRTTVEGLWGNGKRQRFPERMGLGAREPGQMQIPGTGVRSNPLPAETTFQVSEKSSILPAIAAPRRNELPASAETDCGGPSQPVAAPRRNGLRRQAETVCEPPPKQVATEARNQLRRTPEAKCEHIKAKDGGLSISEGVRGNPPPPDDIEARFLRWEGTLDGMFASRLADLQKKLTQELLTAKGEKGRALARRKLAAVKLRIQGPTVVEDAPKPAKAVTVPKDVLPLAEQQRLARQLRPEARV